MSPLVIDPMVRAMFTVVEVSDLAELNRTLRVTPSRTIPRSGQVWKYKLQDRILLRDRSENPVFSIAGWYVGTILETCVESRFATENSIDGKKRGISSASSRHCKVK